jgi:hypothetical protein
VWGTLTSSSFQSNAWGRDRVNHRVIHNLRSLLRKPAKIGSRPRQCQSAHTSAWLASTDCCQQTSPRIHQRTPRKSRCCVVYSLHRARMLLMRVSADTNCGPHTPPTRRVGATGSAGIVGPNRGSQRKTKRPQFIQFLGRFFRKSNISVTGGSPSNPRSSCLKSKVMCSTSQVMRST